MSDALARAIDDLALRGHAAWPNLVVDPERFRAWLAKRRQIDVSLSNLDAAGLYLAFACSEHAEGAIQTFERHYFGEVDAVLQNLNLTPSRDELCQQLRLKLFVAGDRATASIAEFSGRGDLRAWFRIVATRTALNIRRTVHRDLRRSRGTNDLPRFAASDPELAYLRGHYRQPFAAAFSDAFSALTSDQRLMLRQHYVDALSIDKLGVLYGIHRTTAAHRLRRARSALLERTRTLLGERLSLATTDLDSLLRIAESTLEIDLSQLTF